MPGLIDVGTQYRNKTLSAMMREAAVQDKRDLTNKQLQNQANLQKTQSTSSGAMSGALIGGKYLSNLGGGSAPAAEDGEGADLAGGGAGLTESETATGVAGGGMEVVTTAGGTATGTEVGAGAATAAGAAEGAEGGSVVPGLGTAIGAIVGAGVGYLTTQIH